MVIFLTPSGTDPLGIAEKALMLMRKERNAGFGFFQLIFSVYLPSASAPLTELRILMP